MNLARQPAIADAPQHHWVTRYLPHWLQPYAQLMRLDRPVGWWLLLLPCWWGQGLAHVSLGHAAIDWRLAFLFFIGAIVMRGAGCTLNDLTDRDIDAKVARTMNRPIASGRIGVAHARVFLVLQLLVGLVILLQFNTYTVFLGAASLIIVAVYPFMKRITYYPQFVLGLAFNWGALVGWSAVTGRLSTAPLLLYAAGICWTLAYDTIYAHQDKEDDVLIGVKSTALKFGAQTPGYLIGFFAATLVLADAAFWMAGVGWIVHAAVVFAGLHAAWQVAQFDGDDSNRCLKLFKSNRTFGLILALALFLDIILP